MMRAGELRAWLATVGGDDTPIAVDDGGLALVVVGDESVHCEVGGVPDQGEIQEFIEAQQAGRSGIHPHRLAEVVAREFDLPLTVAMSAVLEHMADPKEGGQ